MSFNNLNFSDNKSVTGVSVNDVASHVLKFGCWILFGFGTSSEAEVTVYMSFLLVILGALMSLIIADR